ncbi:MAG: hypothetical protein QM426_03050 [Euryarchaeota archaeon]|nr:hypothetical protein [Euryarchaeota archaeon]
MKNISNIIAPLMSFISLILIPVVAADPIPIRYSIKKLVMIFF